MMSLFTRLLNSLPPFLRPLSPSGITHYLLNSIVRAFQSFQAQFRLLRARGALHHIPGFSEYYRSDDRKKDLILIARSRLLYQRQNETWEDFEQYLQSLFAYEDWSDPNHQNYTVTGDIARWGSFYGITREIEHTGLKVEEIYPGILLPDQWKVWTKRNEPSDPLQLAKTYDLSHTPPPGQRLTKLYSLYDILWTFYIIISNPQNISYSPEEIINIIRLTKPAWTKALVQFPDIPGWIVII